MPKPQQTIKITVQKIEKIKNGKYKVKIKEGGLSIGGIVYKGHKLKVLTKLTRGRYIMEEVDAPPVVMKPVKGKTRPGTKRERLEYSDFSLKYNEEVTGSYVK